MCHCCCKISWRFLKEATFANHAGKHQCLGTSYSSELNVSKCHKTHYCIKWRQTFFLIVSSPLVSSRLVSSPLPSPLLSSLLLSSPPLPSPLLLSCFYFTSSDPNILLLYQE